MCIALVNLQRKFQMEAAADWSSRAVKTLNLELREL
jgi:hypothetical protein